MEGVTRGILFLTLIFFSILANSQEHTMELIWRTTTGAGTPGSDTIKAKAGDILELDLIVTDGGTCWGVRGASATVLWNPGVSAYGLAQVCPAPENNLYPTFYCNDPFDNLLWAAVPNQWTSQVDLLASNSQPVIPYPCNSPMYFGRMTFLVDIKGTHTITVLGGVTDGYFSGHTVSDTATIQPPSGC